MSDADSLTLKTRCAKCGGSVTLCLTVRSPAESAGAQTWKCPHCHEANSGAHLPGKVRSILARQSDPPQPKGR